MDPELKAAIGELKEAAQETRTAANGAKAAANAATNAVHQFSSSVGALTWQMQELWRRVCHEHPPPPPPGWTIPAPDAPRPPLDAPSRPPLASRTMHLERELAEVKAELRQQSRAMALGTHGLAYVLSPEGQKRIATTLGAIAAIIAAGAGLVNACHHAPPAPMHHEVER